MKLNGGRLERPALLISASSEEIRNEGFYFPSVRGHTFLQKLANVLCFNRTSHRTKINVTNHSIKQKGSNAKLHQRRCQPETQKNIGATTKDYVIIPENCAIIVKYRQQFAVYKKRKCGFPPLKSIHHN